jgi:hypothetical protein
LFIEAFATEIFVKRNGSSPSRTLATAKLGAIHLLIRFEGLSIEGVGDGRDFLPCRVLRTFLFGALRLDMNHGVLLVCLPEQARIQAVSEPMYHKPPRV